MNKKIINVLEITEKIVAVIVFLFVIYFSYQSILTFLTKDWSDVLVMYDFIYLSLAILLGLEVCRLILVHNLKIILELMILIVARKVLYPKIDTLDILICITSLAALLGIYYFYKKNHMEDLGVLGK